MNRPIENSYCVVEGKVYAGEYPGDLYCPEEKVKALVDFGITHFIDLTEVRELNPYSQLLSGSCVHHRFPIRDVSIPDNCSDVYKLLSNISKLIETPDNKVYIHCWGGVGRTGTIVGCFYVYNGESLESALTHLRTQFKECPKSKRRSTPETSEQVNFIKKFKDYCKRHKRYRIGTTPEFINSLTDNEVFVFGSNLAGEHAGGAARTAMNNFGAVWGQGIGMQGQSYAIPTMQGGVDTIKPYVDEFISFAKSHPELNFLVTRIGCGIAGFKDEEIAPLFQGALEFKNIFLPKSFLHIISVEMGDDLSLNRFLEGQSIPFADYETALKEVTKGRKASHWIWYIFPQLRGLGQSRHSYYYGISDRHEAEEYLRHPILGVRLREITEALLEHEGRYPEAIFGSIDAMKVKSCMTLFDSVSPNDIFADVLDLFYEGERDSCSIV